MVGVGIAAGELRLCHYVGHRLDVVAQRYKAKHKQQQRHEKQWRHIEQYARGHNGCGSHQRRDTQLHITHACIGQIGLHIAAGGGLKAAPMPAYLSQRGKQEE